MDESTLEITELPVRKWTQDYKEFLEGLIKPEEKTGPPILSDYREHHSDADVHFTLQLLPGQMDACLAAGLHAKFKLTNKMSCGAWLWPDLPLFSEIKETQLPFPSHNNGAWQPPHACSGGPSSTLHPCISFLSCTEPPICLS